MAHPHCHPIRQRLNYLKGKFFYWRASLQMRLHDGELVAGIIGGLDEMLRYNLDVRMLERIRKLIDSSLFPKIIALEAFIELLMVLLQLPSHFLHATLQPFLHFFATGVQRTDYITLS
jgi:hypothetical protein